jgi:transcriptional repressor NrdR
VHCPYCGSPSTRVVDSRLTEQRDSIRRRRECASCGSRFTTYERVEEAPVTVVKRDGSEQRFDRLKLLRGLMRAANKRPVSEEQLEDLADSIAAEVRRGGPKVDAEQVGELALQGLARLDPVTGIQFASVYRNFADLDQLEAEMRRLRSEPVAATNQLPLDGNPVPSEPRASIGRSPRGPRGGGRRKDRPTRSRHVRHP